MKKDISPTPPPPKTFTGISVFCRNTSGLAGNRLRGVKQGIVHVKCFGQYRHETNFLL